jgi:thioredoxin-disulfide reductase
MSKNSEMYDVVIIGSGPAGFTAAVFVQRRGLKSVIVTTELGGQMSKISDIENWPGNDTINGANLALKMKNQVEKLGSRIVYEQAIDFGSKDGEGLFVKTTQKEFFAKAIILAYGKTPRTLRVPGEVELMGKGVTYCVNCDGPLYRNKDVAIVGGGNSALDAALMMGEIAKSVHLIHRRDTLRGEQYLIDKVKSIKNVEIHLNSEIRKIKGTDSVESIDLSDGKNIKVSGVFIEIGFVVNDKLVEGKLDLDKLGQVVVDPHQATTMPGVFAAGDLTNKPYQQLVIAAGEGATAALAAFDYIQKAY